MTIVAAAVSPVDGVWIGSDGQAQWGDVIASRSLHKWTVSPCGRWAVSHSGDAGYINVLAQLQATPGGLHWPEDTGDAGAAQLMRSIREGLASLAGKPGGLTPETKPADAMADLWGWAPILASPAGVWHCDCHLWWCSPAIDGAFFAAGSGDDFAFGAMHALRSAGCASARQLVTAGVDAACHMSATCGGQLYLRKMEARP